MRDLYKVFSDCKGMLDAINIPYGKVAEITVNTRAKSRWGQCRKKSNEDFYTINISEVLLREENSIEGLITTIIHELLHTCPGCMNHGPAWKAWADKVNKTYGCNVKRCMSAYELGIAGAQEIKQRTTRRKRTTKKYSVKAVERFIENELIPHGYDIIPITGSFFDSYICVAPSGYMNHVFRANDDMYDGWYTMRRCKKISASLMAEINAAYDEMYG